MLKLLDELALPCCYLAILCALAALIGETVGVPDALLWVALFLIVVFAAPGVIIAISEACKEW